MYQQKFWKNKNKAYLKKLGIDKPNIFAKELNEIISLNGCILDLAAGIGQDSLYFAREGLNVTSTEYSLEYFKDLRRQSSEEGLDINFLAIDLEEKLPFKDNSFDIVYSHLGLHYFNNENTIELFKEIYRILKKDGIFASIFNSIDDPEIDLFKNNKIEDNVYLSAQGITKHFFSVSYLQNIILDMFNPVVIDNKGKTYKDGDNAHLIRFIGKKL